MNKLDARTHNGELIGQIIFDDVSDTFLFEYEKKWISSPTSYPISPAIPFDEKNSHQSRSLSVRRYFENLLPEGVALDAVAQMGNLSKSNLFGLLRAIM
jgi:serine/threonine-protein kinase HipA